MKRKSWASTNVITKRRDAWLKKLAGVGPVVRGSVVTATRGNHIAHQLTVSIKGKTHTVYIPVDMVQEVKQWTTNYRRMQRIQEEISKLSMALIHRHVPESRDGARSRAARRPSR